MVNRLPALAGGLNQDGEPFLERILPDEVAHMARPQRCFIALFLGQRIGQQNALITHRSSALLSKLLERGAQGCLHRTITWQVPQYVTNLGRLIAQTLERFPHLG